MGATGALRGRVLRAFGTPGGCVPAPPATGRHAAAPAVAAGVLLLLASWNPLDWLGAVQAGLRLVFGGWAAGG
jgi:hypothetical protein